MLLLSRGRTERSPEWIVSNGEDSVGPIPTELLIRGVEEGRIPEQCWVREVHSDAWRRLHQVREVRALYRGDEARSSPSQKRAEAALGKASDAAELLLLLLHGAARATRSKIGALHRFREPVAFPVTSCIIGLSESRLGEVLPPNDPVLYRARRGESVFGSPDAGYIERHIAERLDPRAELAAVAMVPVFYGTELIAMLELGRMDHGYRKADRDAIPRLCALAAARLEEL